MVDKVLKYPAMNASMSSLNNTSASLIAEKIVCVNVNKI